jgi:plasmid maintenance system antidote protein VapI
MWLSLQADYDLRKVRAEGWAELEKRIRPLRAA